MTIEKALFDYMSNHATITTQVSDRIYPEVAPEQTTYPFITFTINTEAHDHYMEGASGLANPNIQIDVWAGKVSDRAITTEAVRASMDGFRGLMDDMEIRNCFLVDKTNFMEPSQEGEGKPIYRASMDFSIWHVESVPTL